MAGIINMFRIFSPVQLSFFIFIAIIIAYFFFHYLLSDNNKVILVFLIAIVYGCILIHFAEYANASVLCNQAEFACNIDNHTMAYELYTKSYLLYGNYFDAEQKALEELKHYDHLMIE